ncbi:hypothetical protein SAMN05444354_109146 [Stigmatella aurantiaca]|uniref:HEAT repeat domain-containing protein n=2 Tax=Stigmatella aurantiaca TaxID=41 RepID=A0A1H7TT10_STIAU|nr:hypothetical protein SAMN05444354_109146 [Stigmatella aurantiaca]
MISRGYASRRFFWDGGAPEPSSQWDLRLVPPDMTSDPAPRPAAPPPPSPRRRVAQVAAALGVLTLLALLARGSLAQGHAEEEASSGHAHAHAGSAPGGSVRRGGPTGPAQPAPPEEASPGQRHFEGTTCWQDLERFNEAVTFETFRDWAAPLLASGDPLVLDYLRGRLAELIGDDPARASEVLGWVRGAPAKEFKVFMGGLKGSQALHRPQVAAQLLEMGLDGELELGRRAGLLAALETQHRFEPAAMDRLARFAQDPASGEAGWIATRTLGRVMKEDLSRTGNAKPYVDRLLSVSAESLEMPVRYLALEMGMHADAPIDAQATARLEKILATEGSGDVRQIAAHELSLAEDKTRALDIYAQAFTTETELCVRWALFRFAARTAGRNALPVMAHMAQQDSRFLADYRDFERLYASGIVDFERIWSSLPTDNPHGCLEHTD